MSRQMEATFYDDAVSASRPPRDGAAAAHAFNPETLKRSMTLDLTSDPKHLRPAALSSRAALDLLTSPDVGLLKLASPELERLIIASCGGLTTPTPTAFACARTITDEQEGFAEGFVRALAELHYHQQGPPAASGASAAASEGGGAPYGCAVRADPPEYTNLGAFGRAAGSASAAPGSGRPLGASYPAEAQQQHHPPPPPPPSHGHPDDPPQHRQHPRLRGLKEEPQTVPEMPGDTPPLSPIDMESQERIKAERKRLRNRVAASKCRKRKLERISRLEDRVKHLKSQNTELVSSANVLRDELALLKQKVMDHVSGGCQLILTQQLQAF